KVAADIYSFCVALYEGLYGVRAVNKKPMPGSHVPAAVGRVVVRGLESKPERRPPSMTALLDALQAARRRRRLGAAALGAARVLGAVRVGAVCGGPPRPA